MGDESKKPDRGPKKVALSEPLSLGDKTVTEVTVRRPTMADIEAADAVGNKEGTKVAEGIEMTARLTGLPPKAVRAMDPDDFLDIQDVIAGFSRRSQATGGNSRSS